MCGKNRSEQQKGFMSEKLIIYANQESYLSQDRIRVLERYGFKVTFCGCAADVLTMLKLPVEERPMMLITDAQLPHDKELSTTDTNDGTETGLALYRWIREQEKTFPVIIYTSSKRLVAELSELEDEFLEVVDDCSQGDTVNEICVAAQLLS